MSSNEADGSPQDNGIENATDEGTNEVTEEASAKEVEEQNEKESKEEQNVEESKEEQKEEEQKPSETQIDQFEADDLFGGEDDEEEEEEGEEIEYGPPEVIETVDLPRSSVAMKHYVRLSNIIGIESKPFDRNTYKEPNRSDGSIAPEAVMRWREIMDENGNLKRESNARIVTWSDRSLQLFIGNEVFDVSMQLNQDVHSTIGLLLL
jgi:RNA polymerase-associated protein LEO1